MPVVNDEEEGEDEEADEEEIADEEDEEDEEAGDDAAGDDEAEETTKGKLDVKGAPKASRTNGKVAADGDDDDKE